MINDTKGHQTGDLLLKQVAKRLRLCTPQGMMVARLGGDEFGLFQSGIKNVEHIQQITMQILDELSHPFVHEDNVYRISASIGVSYAPQHGDSTETLLEHADQAMYKAKREGKALFHIFEPKV
jgi:diguanylate cyclase (GGDEF)-like protein